MKDFLAFNITSYENLLKKNPESFWQNLGAKNALKLFHSASERVPAYKHFLKINKIDPAKIKTISDFSIIPPTNKANYIQQYSLAQKSWDGQVATADLIAMSSGTSGLPNFWPRESRQETEAAISHELIYKSLFKIHKYKTLLIVGFPMGVYVSGFATALPSWLIAQKHYNLTVVSTGNNKQEVIKILKNLGDNFEQIIIAGHPFFLKDTVETARTQGLNLNKYRLKLLLCSEGFSENWREYVAKEAGIKNKENMISLYGSSEFLLMAYETQLSIKIKSLAESGILPMQNFVKPGTINNIFQYNPAIRYIESLNGELLFTAQSGLPLIRFNMHDAGRTIAYSQIRTELKKNKISLKDSWTLPFVNLLGRSDRTIIFYAANIYPEHIHSALHHKPLFAKITGKFSLKKIYRSNMDEILQIHIELKPEIKPSNRLRRLISQKVFNKLIEINSEFADANKKFPKKTLPKIVLWPYQHAKFFKPGLKPKYISE